MSTQPARSAQRPAAPPPSTAIARMPEMPGWLKPQLEPFANRQDIELLLPAIPISSDLGFGMRPQLSVVQIDPDPKNGEVYKVGSRKDANGSWEDVYAYSKAALEKLASAAGIQIRSRRVDDRKDRNYVEFEATGGMRNESGETIIRTGTAGVYFDQYSEDRWTEIVAANAKSKYEKKSEDQLREAHAAEMAQYRKHFVPRVETKAMMRVIRSLLGIKSQLTSAQVAKPKVLVRLAFQPDTSDPEIKRLMVERGMDSTRALYGPGEGSAVEERRTVRTGDAAVVVDDDEDGEPLGPVSDAGEPEAAGAAKSGYALWQEAIAAVGLDLAQQEEILTRNGGDFSKAAAEVSNLANQKAS